MIETSCFQPVVFVIIKFEYLNFFRISIFGFCLNGVPGQALNREMGKNDYKTYSFPNHKNQPCFVAATV